jgi:hypothetical protein
MARLDLVYIATLGWRIISDDPATPREPVASFEEGVARLIERADASDFTSNDTAGNGVVLIVAASVVGE